MQVVSQAWKDNQNEYLVSESFVELTYEIGDPDSLVDASGTDNGATYFSNTPIIVNEVDETMTKYATFEQDMWKLDGGLQLLPESAPYEGTGYVSEGICENDNLFSTNPIVTVSFSKVHSKTIPGITIRWASAYGEYAESFKVTVYNGMTEVSSITVAGNTETLSEVLQDIVGYDKITVEIIKWSKPKHRARIEEIFIGIKRVYDKSYLINYEHSMSADLLSAELPKAEIKFELTNLDGEYNPFNPESKAKYLIERQRFTAKYGYKINNAIEWIKGGSFYLSEWVTPQNGITAEFTARDLFEYMQSRYVGTISNITLYDLAISALTQADLPLNRDGSVKWEIDTSLQSIIVNGADIDDKTTIAEILQMIANAGRCVLYQDRNDRVRIEPLATTPTDYIISQHNSYENSEMELSKKLKAVDVNKGLAVITNDTEGEIQTVDNDLITTAQATTVGTWIKDVLKNRMIMSGEFRADPRLDALDIITVKNKYADTKVAVTEIIYSYNGTFKGEYEGRVIE